MTYPYEKVYLAVKALGTSSEPMYKRLVAAHAALDGLAHTLGAERCELKSAVEEIQQAFRTHPAYGIFHSYEASTRAMSNQKMKRVAEAIVGLVLLLEVTGGRK